MIYGTRDGATTLIVAAADKSAVELDTFYTKAVKARRYKKEWQPTIGEMLMDDRFRGFKRPPFVFEFGNPDNLEEFTKDFEIKVGPHAMLLDRHLDMIQSIAVDPYLSPDADQRTIAEINGIDEEDPWDRRTDEQKAQDEINRKEAEKAKKAGKLSGDSFAPSKRKKKGSSVAVTDIHSTRHEDGSIEIDQVLAVKGLHDDNGKGAWLPLDGQDGQQGEAGGTEAESASTASSTVPAAPETTEADTPSEADPNEQFYRFDLPNGFRQRDGDLAVLSAEIDDWLDVLGDLLDTDSDEARDRMIVSEGTAVQRDWFVLRGERVSHKLSYLLESMQIDHTVEIVDVHFKTIGAFTRDEAIAQHVNPEGWIAIFHRIDVPNSSLWNVINTIKQAEIAQQKELLVKIVAARGQMPDYCWLACASKYGAETLQGVLKADPAYADLEIEVYGINDKGERLVPKGVEIVEEGSGIEPPRPWNDRAAEWAAMDEEARKQDDVRIRGKEFIFCISYTGPVGGCICYITPRRYFNEHGEMWTQSLQINLPEDLKEVEPGVYRTKSRDNLNLAQDLLRRGMIESLAFQMYINNL